MQTAFPSIRQQKKNQEEKEKEERNGGSRREKEIVEKGAQKMALTINSTVNSIGFCEN